VIWVYGGIAVITLVGSYLLARSIGIVGVGIAWLIGNIVIAGGVGVKMI